MVNCMEPLSELKSLKLFIHNDNLSSFIVKLNFQYIGKLYFACDMFTHLVSIPIKVDCLYLITTLQLSIFVFKGVFMGIFEENTLDLFTPQTVGLLQRKSL